MLAHESRWLVLGLALALTGALRRTGPEIHLGSTAGLSLVEEA